MASIDIQDDTAFHETLRWRPQGAPVRVFLIDQDQLRNEITSGALRRSDALTVLGASLRLRNTRRRLTTLRPDLILLEAGTDLEHARTLVLELREILPTIKIVPYGLLTVDDVVTMIETGADGYLMGDASLDTVIRTVVATLHGQPPCSPQVASAVFSRLSHLARWRSQRDHTRRDCQIRLTPREHEVLRWVAEGFRNKEIAQRLEISVPTVKNHVHRILEKLEVGGRREAIQVAFEVGLLEAGYLRRHPLSPPRQAAET